jgi:pilus assembly protein CpaB
MGLLVSIAAGLFAVMAVYLYLDARETELLQQSALQDIVVTTADVLANTPIDERMIRIEKIPRKFVQPGAIAKAGEAIGRVAAVPLQRGSQVTGMALLAGGAESLAFNVPRGMRAVAIAVNDVSGVAGQIRPGNFVDLVGTFEYGIPSGTAGGQITYSQERTEAVTIAQNVQIISLGGAPAEAPRGGEEGPAPLQTEIPPGNVESAILLVTPAQVQEIVLAQQIGSLTLSLRSSLDSVPVELPRLDENTFLRVPMPLKPRAQPRWREMRGTGR